jgi:hypothetical protein
MPTAKEFRLQAKECLELSDATSEFYARTALIELARELNRAAHQAERRERDMGRLFQSSSVFAIAPKALSSASVGGLVPTLDATTRPKQRARSGRRG